MAGAFLQISLYLLSVQIGIPSMDDTILHEKRSAAGYERRGHGSAGIWSIPPAGGGADDIYTGSGDVRFGQ